MIAALAMITGSAYAADWNFYGSTRLHTTFVDGGNYTQALQGNSRIGARVKATD